MVNDNRVFQKEDFKTYDIRELNGKTLEMRIQENNTNIILLGEDKTTGKIYVIAEKTK